MNWADGEAYEGFMGRWSRLVAREFLAWLATPPRKRWLDVGCGTGELSRVITEMASPASVTAIDPAESYIAYARSRSGEAIHFRTGDAQSLPFEDGSFDATVSGLMLNFVPEPDRAASEMARVTESRGLIGVYVWDYAEGMELLRHFWDAAAEVDPRARDADEGPLFRHVCSPDALRRLFQDAGAGAVETRAIEVAMLFENFDRLWAPVLGGQGPSGTYVLSLSPDRQTALQERLRERVPTAPDGSIRMIARAWAVKGMK